MNKKSEQLFIDIFYYLVSELKRFLSPGQDETVLFSATSDILIVRTNQVKFQLINYLYWFENLCFFKPKTILWMMKISKICLKQNLIFSKFWQSTTFFFKSANFFSSFFLHRFPRENVYNWNRRCKPIVYVYCTGRRVLHILFKYR